MKTIIFGPENAGKTSLMRTTCLGYNFMKVANLKPTRGVSRENFIFRGLLEVSVWDLGGQEIYLERHLSEKQKPIIFGDVDVAIFMVDSTRTDDFVRKVFNRFLEALFEFSPQIEKVYILLNKIDLEESAEDVVFEMLTKDLEEEFRSKTAFTPVSVKEGSAQHRLIEVLDFEIQKSTLSMQRLSKIRSILDKLKIETNADFLLFNRPDGLLYSSTLGKFSLEPFEYMKFEIGTLDSNLYQIYQKIYQVEKKIPISPLLLSSIIYESEENYVVVREISDKAVLMVMTGTKDDGVLNKLLDSFKGPIYEELKKFIRASAI
jgi:GTPase SAR1 family protein